MKSLSKELLSNEDGFILSAEMVLILTIAVLGIVVGLAQVQQAVVSELQDLSLAFSGLNQSYMTPAFRGCFKRGRPISWSAGSGFIDFYDGCVGGAGGSTGMNYGSGEIITGAGCAITIPLQCPAPTVLVPQPMSAPCEGCQPGSEVVLPTPALK